MSILLAKFELVVSKDREQDVVNYLESEDRGGVTVEYDLRSNDELTSTFTVQPYWGVEQAEEFAAMLHELLSL